MNPITVMVTASGAPGTSMRSGSPIEALFARAARGNTTSKIAAMRAMMAAMWVLTAPVAISTSSVTTGIAAAMVDSAGLPNGS